MTSTLPAPRVPPLAPHPCRPAGCSLRTSSFWRTSYAYYMRAAPTTSRRFAQLESWFRALSSLRTFLLSRGVSIGGTGLAYPMCSPSFLCVICLCLCVSVLFFPPPLPSRFPPRGSVEKMKSTCFKFSRGGGGARAFEKVPTAPPQG